MILLISKAIRRQPILAHDKQFAVRQDNRTHFVTHIKVGYYSFAFPLLRDIGKAYLLCKILKLPVFVYIVFFRIPEKEVDADGVIRLIVCTTKLLV